MSTVRDNSEVSNEKENIKKLANTMPMLERIILGPLKKYQKYNHYPYKLVAHILLMIVCTAQVILVISTAGAYSRAEQNVFFTLFLNDEIETFDPAAEKVTHFLKLDDFSENISDYLDNYFSLGEPENNYFESYELVEDPDENGEPTVKMDIFYLPGVSIEEPEQIRQKFRKGEKGIFEKGSEQEMKRALQNARYFTLTYEICNVIPMNNAKNRECYKWDVVQKFDFESRSHFSLNLLMEKSFCEGHSGAFGSFFGRFIWLHLLSIILASFSLFFNIRYIFNIFKNFQNMKKYQKSRNRRLSQKKKKYRENLNKISRLNRKESNLSPSINDSKNSKKSKKEKNKVSKYLPSGDFEDDDDFIPPDWDDLTNKDKLKLFNTWILVIIFGCIFLIVGSIFLTMNTRSMSTTGEIFLGFGSMLTWFSFLRFYQNTKGFNIISNTIENSFEIVCKALAGIMPIFIGFGLLGTCLFWRSHRFTDLSTSMFTLFATMNGDMIWDVWHDIDTINFLLAQLFLYTFILLSICLIFNVFIVIIEDGYIMQKFFARTDWVRGVNQRSSLHKTEQMMKEGQHSHPVSVGRHNEKHLGGHINTTNFPQPETGIQDMQRMQTSSLSEGVMKHSHAAGDIPMLHGAPLPHDGDPFIRILKKSKKDIKSRKALIKMLRHEKLDILKARQQLKLEQMNENGRRSTSQKMRMDASMSMSLRLDEEDRDAPPPPFSPGIQDQTNSPENIAMRIEELVSEFQRQYEHAISSIPEAHPSHAELVEAETRKYSINADFIRNTLSNLQIQ